MTEIPTLTTDRLIMRAPAARDLEPFVEFFTSDRAEFVGGKRTPDVAWRLFASEIGHWHITGCGMWTVTMNNDDTPLGLVGCWYPGDWPEREIGWLIWQNAEGKGIAQEAAKAARDHAYSVFGWETAVSYIDQKNTRSIALAERLGATHDPKATFPRGHNGLVYRHPAPKARP